MGWFDLVGWFISRSVGQMVGWLVSQSTSRRSSETHKHLGEGALAVLGVAEVVQDHHHDHQHCVAHRQDVEGRPPNVLGFYIEIKIALETYVRSDISERCEGPAAATYGGGGGGTGR